MTDYLLIIWFHFISDFLLQTDTMALNKSTSKKWLSIHCLIYSIPFIYFGFKIWLIALISHYIIDYITSRLNKYFWENEKRKLFFVTIGFDQALHLTVLILCLE